VKVAVLDGVAVGVLVAEGVAVGVGVATVAPNVLATSMRPKAPPMLSAVPVIWLAIAAALLPLAESSAARPAVSAAAAEVPFTVV